MIYFFNTSFKRSETHMYVLNSRIDDFHRMNTEAVYKSKSIFQNENATLKSAYGQATFKFNLHLNNAFTLYT